MGFPKAQVQQWQSNARAARTGAAAPPAKVRKKTGTGDWAVKKQWWAEMARGTGEFSATPLVSNAREHHMVRANRVLEERKRGYYIGCRFLAKVKLPVVVTLTRYGSQLLDDDNLRGAFKGLRDGIADAFGCDDSDNGKITWVYAAQVKAPKGCFGVRIVIAPAAPATARAVGGAV